MDGEGTYSIGELARLSGLTVKAVRFYSDRGVVPEAGRTASGHRRYGPEAPARIGLVRTLRELGIGLAAIRKIIDREVPAAEIAAAHAEAVAVRIRLLRLRHAVLATAARRDSTPEEIELMHRLARLSAAERDGLITGFLDGVFGDPAADPLTRALHRSLAPELPDDPAPEQWEAWLELAELTQDPSFRSLMHTLFTGHTEHVRPTAPPRKDAVALIAERVPPLLTAKTTPTSPEAARAVTEITTAYAALRAHLTTHLTAVNDPRRERYLTLLSTINGWPPPRHPRRELTWFLTALQNTAAPH